MKKICALHEIPNRQAKSYPYDENYTLLIYRNKERAFAYINSCPHAGVPLEWNSDQFMSFDGFSLQCGTHGAQFEPSTGLCFYGPCKGARLHKVAISLDNGIVYLD
ncbi:MAG: Rieske 2Fe-2S domain-containing protein [Gammaproteobacteria bacterium]|nr:Rieske 2Fe-2S domain-containing protein [Gammaproteobacteria bacterium]